MKAKIAGLTVYEKTIDKHGHHKWICKCRNTYCETKIIVRIDNRHEGYCRPCGQALKRKRPYEALYNNFVSQNKFNNQLTYEDFYNLCLINQCHYCQAPTIRSKFKSNKTWRTAYMIDRKNNDIGYTVKNCVSCCWPCNDLKSNRFTYNQFIKLSEFIKTLHN